VFYIILCGIKEEYDNEKQNTLDQGVLCFSGFSWTTLYICRKLCCI